MTKANTLIEMFAPWMYSGKVIVFVRQKNKLLVKHYYDIDEDNRLMIYPKDTENYEKNPKIKGKGITLDAGTKNMVFVYNEGDDFATPIFDTDNFQDEYVTSSYGFRLINFGKRLENLNNPFDKLKSSEDKIMLAIIILLVAQLATLFLIFQITQHLGIKFY